MKYYIVLICNLIREGLLLVEATAGVEEGVEEEGE